MASKGGNRLSVKMVETLKEPGRYPDGDGLYLNVKKTGSKSWLFFYSLNKQARREMGLGPFPTVSLKDARFLAVKCRQQLLLGIDPLEERKKEEAAVRLEEARALCFDDCADAYIEAHRASWKNAKHAQQWPNTIKTYASPVFGALPVADIDTALVMKCLEPIWLTKTETAKRLRGRIEAVLDWATVREYRKGGNPARWRGHLDKLLSAPSKVRTVKHHSALPYSEVASFIKALRQRDGIGARGFEFLILSAARTSETTNARWEEIDLEAKVWTIPAERMKAGKLHRVPLSPRMVEILKEIGPRSEGYVFQSSKKGKPLSSMAFEMVLRNMERRDITAHGFRSSFRDWAAEITGFPHDVIEMALAHAIGNKVEAAYRRGDLFEKRERLMNEWGRWCEYGPPVTADVVKLNAQR